jgi:hypothetical protein
MILVWSKSYERTFYHITESRRVTLYFMNVYKLKLTYNVYVIITLTYIPNFVSQTVSMNYSVKLSCREVIRISKIHKFSS